MMSLMSVSEKSRFISFRVGPPFRRMSLTIWLLSHSRMSHTSDLILICRQQNIRYAMSINDWQREDIHFVPILDLLGKPRSHLSTINRFQIVINLFFSIVNFAFYSYC